MEAFFFGSSSSALYGVYHSPSAGRDRFEGIVMCYPFGQEYMRAHRAFRQLGDQLAKKGYHVLRFDYRGTGDSAGELEDVSPHDWLVDIETAVQELKDVSGVKKVSLLGLRLGGLLAGQVAADNANISRLILWDPVISGGAYISELCGDIKTVEDGALSSKSINAEGAIHFNGFCMTAGFQQALEALNLLELTVSPGLLRLLLVSHENDDFKSLKECWGGDDSFLYQHQAAPYNWNYVDHVGGIMLPQPVMQAIVNNLS